MKICKKIMSYLLAATLALSCIGITAAAADTENAFVTASGGTYALATIGENLVCAAKADGTVIVDESAGTVTLSPADNYSESVNFQADYIKLGSNANWKNTGYTEVTFDTKLSGEIKTGANLAAGLRVKYYDANNAENAWDSGILNNLRSADISDVEMNVKYIFSFDKAGNCVTKVYSKLPTESAYTYRGEANKTGLSTSKYTVPVLIPYITFSSKDTQNKNVKAIISNITVKEGYNTAQLENITESCDRSGSAEVNYNIPEGYETASLTVGGVTAKSFNAATDAAGAYKTTAALSKLPYWGNVPVVLNVDGEEVKTTAINVVYSNEKTVLAEDDFSISGTRAFTVTTTVSNVTAGGKTGEMLVITNSAYNNELRYTFPAIEEKIEGNCYEFEFEAFSPSTGCKLGLTSKYSNSGWNTPTWNYIYTISDNTNWHKVRIVTDVTEQKAFVYVDGSFAAESSYVTNGFQYISLAMCGKSGVDLYIDNVKLSKYKKGNKPALASASVNNDNAAVTLTFDSALLSAATQDNVKLTANGTEAAAEVSYDETAKTVTVTPTGSVESKNASVVIDKALLGTSEDMEVSVVLPSVYNRALTKNGNTYTGSIYAFADGVQSLGRIYIAVYNGTKLEAVGTQKMQATKAGSSEFTCTFKTDKTGTAKMIVLGDDLTPLCGTTGATD